MKTSYSFAGQYCSRSSSTTAEGASINDGDSVCNESTHAQIEGLIAFINPAKWDSLAPFDLQAHPPLGTFEMVFSRLMDICSPGL
jgi:hypothetical protein